MMASAALTGPISQLSRTHALIKTIAKKLKSLVYTFSQPVQTNMEAAGVPPAAVVPYCKAAEVEVYPGRLVFHCQTTEDAANRLVEALAKLMADKKAGKNLKSGNASVGCF